MSNLAGAFFIAEHDNEERWDGPFDTVEQAVAEGRERWGHDAPVYVGVGEEVSLSAHCSDLADAVVEHVSESVYAEVGDAAEIWPDLSKEDAKALDDVLARTVADFLADRGYTPSFVKIVRVVRHPPLDANEEEQDE